MRPVVIVLSTQHTMDARALSKIISIAGIAIWSEETYGNLEIVQRVSMLLFGGVELRVNRGVALPFLREVFQSENGSDRADRDAGTAVDAFGGIDIELRHLFMFRLILTG